MKNTINNVMEVNGQKVVIENNSRNSTFHMTMEDLRVFQPEKFDIISQYFQINSGLILTKGYAKNSISVVDITAGRIYPNLALGKNSINMNDYLYTRVKVMEAIESTKPLKSSNIIDYMGNVINNHILMYAEDIPTAILKEYLRIEKIRIEEENNAKHLKKEVK